jgi:hypothetical protein
MRDKNFPSGNQWEKIIQMAAKIIKIYLIQRLNKKKYWNSLFLRSKISKFYFNLYDLNITLNAIL